MMGLKVSNLLPLVKMLVTQVAPQISEFLHNAVKDGDLIGRMRDSVDRLVTNRLNELTPLRVKLLLSAVMEKNLGWLVVWGNVFGALIGIISEGVGY